LRWEEDGLPRIAGRIFGFLLLEPDACSLDDMASALGVSKASVSTDARQLERLGLIERVGKAADRRDYYRIAPDMPVRALRLRLEIIDRFTASLAAIGELPVTPAVRNRLQHFSAVHDRTVAAMRGLLRELEQDAAAPLSTPRSGASRP
jgi:biotin operon repressor